MCCAPPPAHRPLSPPPPPPPLPQVAAYIPSGSFLVYSTVVNLILGSEGSLACYGNITVTDASNTTHNLRTLSSSLPASFESALLDDLKRGQGQWKPAYADPTTARGLIVAWTVVMCIACCLSCFTDTVGRPPPWQLVRRASLAPPLSPAAHASPPARCNAPPADIRRGQDADGVCGAGLVPRGRQERLHWKVSAAARDN